MELGKVKSKIEKISKDKNIDIQTAWDMFFFENFLYCISQSEYASRFVFKGGFYLQRIVGIESRSTMDIDLKLIGNDLSEPKLKSMMQEICSYKKENLCFSIKDIQDITAKTKYGGKTVKIEGKFFNIRKVFGVDIGIGDVVTPSPTKYSYPTYFIDEKYEVFAYSIETIIAEKLETLVSLGTNNSRSKDLVDLYLLDKKGFEEDILTAAIINTFHLRGTGYSREHIESIINEVFAFERIEFLFNSYCKKHSFAKNIHFLDCKKSILSIFSKIHFLEKIDIASYNIELHLVRHGQDEVNKLGGWSSNHLNDNGILEVESLGDTLDDRYDLFISSDLTRAKESALILNQRFQMDIIFSKEFREMNNGDLADLTLE
ncbi:MAG: nucleotidyl transferase AbiEii/AbiGii toxin family protein, partial [Anaeroplasmataceae bacterium]|nr:nucleotidyl transferase AbiEii/AbiGii toxin family protein [Anaeroplasmataceae bacterium]